MECIVIYFINTFFFYGFCVKVIRNVRGEGMKSIVTVVGLDQVGIIAGVCNLLSEHNVNVLDINQTILDGFFNMMMIVDLSKSTVDFNDLSENLDALGNKLNVRIQIQQESIFNAMHRI